MIDRPWTKLLNLPPKGEKVELKACFYSHEWEGVGVLVHRGFLVEGTGFVGFEDVVEWRLLEAAP